MGLIKKIININYGNLEKIVLLDIKEIMDIQDYKWNNYFIIKNDMNILKENIKADGMDFYINLEMIYE